MINLSKFLPFFIPNVYRACSFFTVYITQSNNFKKTFTSVPHFNKEKEAISPVSVVELHSNSCTGEFVIECKAADSIHMVQSRGWLRAFVRTVMTFGFHRTR